MTVLGSISSAGFAAACLWAPVVVAAQAAQSEAPHGYSYTVVHAFKGPSDGAYPWAGLVRGNNGNLYGTSWAGGSHANCKGGLGAGCGSLFQLDGSGKEKVIYSFVGLPGPIHLYGELLPARDASFFGVTNEGGTSTACYNGCGALFQLTENHKLNVLYNFGSNGGASDANWPAGGLVRDPNGNLYGTSSYGGTNNNGTVWEFNRSGTESVLYRFTGGADGASPSPDLLLDSAGNLYGATASGGGSCNCGTIFKLDPGGTLTVLYTFQGGTAGGTPITGLIRDPAGNLYGTTSGGGDPSCGGNYGCGTVFRLDSGGVETVLHAFSGNPDGELPVSRLMRDKAGNLYGVTYLGGDSSCNCGVVFEVAAGGKERVLHAFKGGKDGMYSWGRVYLDSAGDVVGTTQQGGNYNLCPNGCGVVYKLVPSSD